MYSYAPADILATSLGLAEEVTAVGATLPEATRSALRQREIVNNLLHGDTGLQQLEVDTQNGTIPEADVEARTLEVAQRMMVKLVAQDLHNALLKPQSRAVRAPILAEADRILDELRPKFEAAAAGVAAAKDLPENAEPKHLTPKTLPLYQALPAHIGTLDRIAAAVLAIGKLHERTKLVADVHWFIADSADSQHAVDHANDGWHALVAAGHVLSLASVDDVLERAASHNLRALEAAEKAAQVPLTPLDQTRLDATRALLRR